MISHVKLRELCNFQYWLGSNYTTLPTNSTEMTERASKYNAELKKEKQSEIICDCKNNLYHSDNNEWCYKEQKRINPNKEFFLQVKICNAPKDYICNVNDNGICKVGISCIYQKQ